MFYDYDKDEKGNKKIYNKFQAIAEKLMEMENLKELKSYTISTAEYFNSDMYRKETPFDIEITYEQASELMNAGTDKTTGIHDIGLFAEFKNGETLVFINNDPPMYSSEMKDAELLSMDELIEYEIKYSVYKFDKDKDFDKGDKGSLLGHNLDMEEIYNLLDDVAET
ncbi:MAG: hypothetical protein GX982_07445 [Tissierellia bacterium]|nr:hypothetical protein [Tissierellia bacterium]